MSIRFAVIALGMSGMLVFSGCGDTRPTTTESSTVASSGFHCCKYCSKGKACGDSCISRSLTCHHPSGCACDR